MARKDRTIPARPAPINVDGWAKLGPYRVAPPDLDLFVNGVNITAKSDDWGGVDFCIGVDVVWSIGRATRDLTFTWEGVQHVIRKGQVLVSPSADLYSHDGFDCLWLR